MSARTACLGLLAAVIAGLPGAAWARDHQEIFAAAAGYARLARLVHGPAAAPPQAAGETGRLAAQIRAAALRNGIRPEFLLAVIEVESNFDPRAVSPRNALGLAQVTPAAALDVGIVPGHLWLPDVNAEAGARYLRWLGERHDWDASRMLIGYNAGPRAADGRRPVPAQTRTYVAKVMAAYRRRLAELHPS